MQNLSINKTGSTTKVFVLCNTLWTKFRGVMLKKDFPPHVFILRKEKSITLHTFLCKHIDIICLDTHHKIVSIDRDYPPNKIGVWNAKTIIETTPNYYSNIKVGDTFKIT